MPAGLGPVGGYTKCHSKFGMWLYRTDNGSPLPHDIIFLFLRLRSPSFHLPLCRRSCMKTCSGFDSGFRYWCDPSLGTSPSYPLHQDEVVSILSFSYFSPMISFSLLFIRLPPPFPSSFPSLPYPSAPLPHSLHLHLPVPFRLFFL
jgi:hypothetical protein